MRRFFSALLACSLFFGIIGGAAAQEVKSASSIYSAEVHKTLEYINKIRKNMGLGSLQLDPYLTKASKNHANYVDKNGEPELYETKGRPGFTGITLENRINAAGGKGEFYASGYQIIGHPVTSMVSAVDLFLGSSEDRIALVESSLTHVGMAKVNNVVVMTFVGYSGKYGVSAYPYDGQENVPTSISGNDAQKFGLSKAGYIISFTNSRHIMEILDSVIKDSAGNLVPHYQELYGNYWFFYPKRELKKGETYTVNVQYSPFWGEGAGEKFSETWSFTTKGEKRDVKVKINGSAVNLNPAAQNKNGSTFIPLRGVFEKLGSTVKWEQASKTVTIVRNGVTIKMTSGNKKAYVNGKVKNLPAAPYISNGTSYVPLRFVSETIGAEVNWNQKEQTVSIVEKK